MPMIPHSSCGAVPTSTASFPTPPPSDALPPHPSGDAWRYDETSRHLMSVDSDDEGRELIASLRDKDPWKVEEEEVEKLRGFLASLGAPWAAVYEQLVAEWLQDHEESLIAPETDRLKMQFRSKMRKHAKQVLMSLALPGYTNYLSFAAAGEDPPFGLSGPPNPIRVSKRDFSRRLVQFKHFVHRHDSIAHEATIDALRSDPDKVFEGFCTERLRILSSRSRKRYQRVRLKKRQRAEEEAAAIAEECATEGAAEHSGAVAARGSGGAEDPDHWRREVMRMNAERELRERQRREAQAADDLQRGCDPAFWREELQRLAATKDQAGDSDSEVNYSDAGVDGLDEDDDEDDEDCIGWRSGRHIAGDVISSILETRDEAAELRHMLGERGLAPPQRSAAPPQPSPHAAPGEAAQAHSRPAVTKKRKRKASLPRPSDRNLDALKHFASLSISQGGT